MRINSIARAMAILGVLAFGTAAQAAEDGDLSAELRQVVERKLAGFNSEDPAETMRHVHTKSPEYSVTEEALPVQFEELDARSKIVSFRYIGHDDEFAVARVKLETVDQSGEPFSANVIDTITLFHQENGEWKFWSDYVLGVELVQ